MSIFPVNTTGSRDEGSKGDHANDASSLEDPKDAQPLRRRTFIAAGACDFRQEVGDDGREEDLAAAVRNAPSEGLGDGEATPWSAEL